MSMVEKHGIATPAAEKEAVPRLAVSLSGEINAATRSLHTNLNRLITTRLPLALPPLASDPSLYTTGLLHFAHVFLTFESLWADLLRDHASAAARPTSPRPSFAFPSSAEQGITSPPTSPLLSYLLVNPYDSPSFFTSTLGAPTPPSPQLAAFLQTLRPNGLLRSGRLKKDLEYLLDLHPTDLEVLLAKYPGDKVADFCTHIRKSVNEKPWTLVSYAWCFYMAIFSGGRWIRASLLKAGPEFWPVKEEEEKKGRVGLVNRGLSFWHFAGPYDGEDIKAEFKLRLAAAEDLFTPDERVDIIEEAKNIFHLCPTLVEELDTIVADSLASAQATDGQKSATEEKALMSDADPPSDLESMHVPRPSDPITAFLRRPEVTGGIVALGCLVGLALMRFE